MDVELDPHDLTLNTHEHDPGNINIDFQSWSTSIDSGQQQQRGGQRRQQRAQRRRQARDATVATGDVDNDNNSAWTDVYEGDEGDEMPPRESISGGRVDNRRARVDDDQDQDRRHPSQRVPQMPPAAAPPPHAHGHPMLLHGAGGAGAAPPVQLFIPSQNGVPLRGATHAADFTLVFALPPPNDSPANAARIIAGLDSVPEGLVRRLERVSALANTAHEGKDDADLRCAICWERLLKGDGAEFALLSNTGDDAAPSALDTDAASDSASKDPPLPQDTSAIIALPCAHVFHTACLYPWFAIPTRPTCPTCRFDLDPADVIWSSNRFAPSLSDTMADEMEGEANLEFSFDLGDGGDLPEGGDGAGVFPPGFVPMWPPGGIFGGAPPVNDADERDGDDTILPLGPIPGREAPNTTANPAPPPAAPTNTDTDTAAAPPPANTAANAPPTNPARANPTQPQGPGGHANTFTLDFGFSTLGPIPPPANLAGAAGGAPHPTQAAAGDQAQPQGPPGAQAPPQAGAGPQGTGAAGPQPQAGAPGDNAPFNLFAHVQQFMGVAGLGINAAGEVVINANANTDAPTPAGNANAGPPPANAIPGAQGANANAPPAPFNNLYNGSTEFRILHFHHDVSDAPVPPPSAGAPAGAPEPQQEWAPPPQQEWAPPPGPGPTLRDRVECREREAGLRCADASCRVGPSDEDPFVDVPETARRQLELPCGHSFHPLCLGSAQRAREGWREPVLDGEGTEKQVKVVTGCSLCHAEGSVPQAEWL